MRSIVLSGFMGTGKSTVGRRLAERLGVAFADSDAIVEERAGASIETIFRNEGEPAFRTLEAGIVEDLLRDPTPRVVAAGGGALLRRATRCLALDRALVVTLTAKVQTILERVAGAGPSGNATGLPMRARPLLAVPDRAARIEELLASRAEAYAECHLSLATDDTPVEAIVGAVVALIERDPLVVPLGPRTYTIDLTRDEPARLAASIARLAPTSLVVVTDANVQRARGRTLDLALAALSVSTVRITLPAGEEHKTLANVSAVWDAALGAGVDRGAVVLAFGGGVVGDLAGFAASALLRGVRYVQAPTTLLAMVDASVGGKTGFDHPAGKNLLGAFHQPSAVVADLAHLSTLPERERACGMAEVVKVALVADDALFGALEQHAEALAQGSAERLLPVVRAAIAAKARIVRDDEREGGARALLNFGHTIGHAIEAHGGFTRYRHGEAVALGLVTELGIGASLGDTPPDLAPRVARLLARLGLASELPAGELARAWPFVMSDKKRAAGLLAFPVVSAPGQAALRRLPLDELRRLSLTG